MNIFYLSSYPEVCAKMHNDSHCSKMIIEYAQLMSTAHRYLDGEMYYGLTKNGRKIKRWKVNSNLEDVLYKASHINHPSAIWVRQSKENYEYLYKLWTELHNEFVYRYRSGSLNPHESYRKLHEALKYPPINIPEGNFTQPTPAMPDDVKDKCSILSYRKYYNKYKQHLAKWSKREVPEWFEYASNG